MPIPQVAAAQAGAEGALKVGEAVVDTLKQPIIGRKRTFVWDDETQEWVPERKESTQQLTVGGLLAGGLLALGALAVGQRAIRTGTVGIGDNVVEEEVENSTTHLKRWVKDASNLKSGWVKTGRTRTRSGVKIRSRESIADYNKIG